MAGRAPRSRAWRLVPLAVLAVLVLGGIGANYLISSATTTSTTSTTTTTTVAPERHQLGWTIASSSRRGVTVDFRNLKVGAVTYRAVRLRARTTLLRWHVGSGDPNLWAKAPADAGPMINWPNEGLAGVLAVFNGGFKQSANAGGAVVDGVPLSTLVKGDMTVVIDRGGHWEMGVWGSANFPTAGFHPIAYRQNLVALVQNGALTPAASSSNWNLWGSPLHLNPMTARTGLGVDARGNLIYVATMMPQLARPLALALIAAGAVTGMELDINPYWPVLGASHEPIHHPGGVYIVQLTNAYHSPNVYDAGWSRDFFVALAEPASWTCNWQSAGLRGGIKGAQPQPLSLVGKGCHVASKSPTTAASIISTTSTSTTLSTPAS
jgi:hypothetical protein